MEEQKMISPCQIVQWPRNWYIKTNDEEVKPKPHLEKSLICAGGEEGRRSQLWAPSSSPCAGRQVGQRIPEPLWALPGILESHSSAGRGRWQISSPGLCPSPPAEQAHSGSFGKRTPEKELWGAESLELEKGHKPQRTATVNQWKIILKMRGKNWQKKKTHNPKHSQNGQAFPTLNTWSSS